MSINVTDDKIRRIVQILAPHLEVREPKAPPTPTLHMRAIADVLNQHVPLVFNVQTGEHTYRLALPEGYADSEAVGKGNTSVYNVVLRILGNQHVLPETCTMLELSRCHVAIFNRTMRSLTADYTALTPEQPKPPKSTEVEAEPMPEPVAPVVDAGLCCTACARAVDGRWMVADKPYCQDHWSDGLKATVSGQKSTPAAKKAAPTPKEAKRKMNTNKPYVWITKAGVEQRLTEAQFMHRVNMVGGLHKVPVGCGEVGDEFAEPVLLQDNVEPDIEWVDDIPYVADPDEPNAVVEQHVEADDAAKIHGVKPEAIQRLLALAGKGA